MKTRDVLAVFNRGRISKLALARTDVGRVALSAKTQTNWMPRTLGSMSLRPGLKYNGAFQSDGAMIPFIFSTDEVAALELTAGEMRIWDNGDTLLTRASVSSAVTNGDFTTNLTGWTNADDGGAASTWNSGNLRLEGTGTAAARRRQEVTVSGGDVGTEHALRIVIDRGPVVLRVGSTAGSDDFFRQAVLRTGTHSIAFTPTANFWIDFSSTLAYGTLVDSCNVESAGTVVLDTPWDTVAKCKCVRWHQPADVIYVACDGERQSQIERRPNGSWSVVDYLVNDGPFLTENTSSITITPDAITGGVTLTASEPIFQTTNVGSLYSLTSQGQDVSASLAAELTYTDPIRVSGVTESRIFQVIISGTWSGTLTLQRSFGEVGAWEDVKTYTVNGTTSEDDTLDNAIVFYRLGFNAGDYTSGTAVASLSYSSGSITGTVRVEGFTSETVVTGIVLNPLGKAEATTTWAEGAWSDRNGWPSAVAIWEGRLWWGGSGRGYGSVSDGFTIFDPAYEGDAAPINRRVGEKAVTSINWMLPLQHLVVGTDGSENSIRSTSFDEPVTPSNYNTKAPSTRGSFNAPAVISDSRGYFIDRTKRKIHELEYDASKYAFAASDMTVLVPEIGDERFIRIDIQQTPDTRLHCVREDGTVGILVRDSAEDVLCWVDVETDGEVQDVIVLPSVDGDRVIYRVKRSIDGSDAWYNEEWASADDCVGGDLNLQADSFITGAGSVTGLDHLEGETVVIWADGADQGTGVVASGAVAGASYTNWVAGLEYQADYESAKLAGQTQLGLSLTQRTRINTIGAVLVDTHYQGLQYGPSADVLDDLPLIEDGVETAADTVWSEYDKGMVEFPGDWSTDNRVYLRATAPRPCTLSGVVLNVDRQDKD